MSRKPRKQPRMTPYNWAGYTDEAINIQPPRRGSEFMRWKGDDPVPYKVARPDATKVRKRKPTPKQDWFLLQQDTDKRKA